jgi:hypothetical protein
MIDLEKNTIDLDFFQRILKEIKNADEINATTRKQLIDSFGVNQLTAKSKLISTLTEIGAIDTDTNVSIFGCWYGSILISVLAPKVNRIVAIDLDHSAVRIGKNRLFKYSDNVVWITDDVFTKWLDEYKTTTVFINTSCEHMRPMREWPWWNKLENDAYFAFTSNTMDYIEGHVNCVYSLDEFKLQLPENFQVLVETELVEERGTKYTLVGKIIKP